jgi:hypothetical protein
MQRVESRLHVTSSADLWEVDNAPQMFVYQVAKLAGESLIPKYAFFARKVLWE